MKIIFINGTPLSKVWAEKVNLEWYIDNGFNLEFWNIDRIYYTEEQIDKYFRNNKFISYLPPNQKIFKSKNEVKEKLLKIEKNSIFCFLDFSNHDDFWLRRLFKINNTIYYVGPRVVGYHGEKYNIKNKLGYVHFFLRRILNAFSDENFLKRTNVFLRFKNYIYKKYNYYQKPIFVASSGLIGRKMWMNKTFAREFLSIPSVEIDWTKKKRLIDYKYGVFVDDTIFFSPDYNLNHKDGMHRTNNIEKYLENLLSFFNIIEHKLNIKIIIAASGKYIYDENPYQREIIYKKTSDLIQHADIVIGHNSSALNQGIINRKPIITIFDSTIKKEKLIKIHYVSEYLNLKPMNIENISDKKLEENLLRTHSSEKVIENYFLENDVNTPVKASYEIIAQKIKKLEIFK